MKRNRYWRRKKNYTKGCRKKRIAELTHRDYWYKHDGQYIKGKIHCSCPSCSPKTNNRGYGSAMNWKHADILKIHSMDFQEKELL